jgi:drug/metabolite transporter (DMT)-like permease
MTRSRWPLLAAMATTLVLWASAFVAIRSAMTEYSPGGLALVRFGVASLAFGVWALLRPGSVRRADRADLPGFLLTGLVGITLYHVALNAGERTVSAGSASLIVNLNPIFTALIAGATLGERLGPRGWAGVLAGFAGAAILAIGESGGLRIEPGAWLLLVAALAQAIYFVLQKPYLSRYRPLEATAWAVWLGTLCLLPATPGALADLRTASAAATLGAVYLGVFPGAIAYASWAYVLSRLPAGRATSALYLVPPIALVIGWVMLGERPGALALAGGAVALSGVALVNAGRAARAPATPARAPGAECA